MGSCVNGVVQQVQRFHPLRLVCRRGSRARQSAGPVPTAPDNANEPRPWQKKPLDIVCMDRSRPDCPVGNTRCCTRLPPPPL